MEGKGRGNDMLALKNGSGSADGNRERKNTEKKRKFLQRESASILNAKIETHERVDTECA